MSKYKSKKVVYDGMTFDSKKEMNRYIELRILENAEAIARTLSEVVPYLLDDSPAADVQPANQWISVKDRLPNHYEEVLAVSKLENIVYFAWYDADISMFMGHSHMWTTKEVTHWMPLPEPPKDGDTECQ